MHEDEDKVYYAKELDELYDTADDMTQASSVLREAHLVQKALRISEEVMKQTSYVADMKVFGKDLILELIIQLDKNRHVPLINLALIALIEHHVMVRALTNDLTDAVKLLADNGIPFDSTVDINE